MSLRLLLLAAVIYFAPKSVLAKSTADQAKPAAGEQVQTDNEPEQITHRQGLAAAMGLTQQDVVFGKPRNFRSESLNNFGLEPIMDEEE